MKARVLSLGVAAIAVGPFIGMTGAQAAPAPQVVYVTPSSQGSTGGAHHGHHGPDFHSVDRAIDAVAKGGTVVVEKGTYHEDVTVDKAVRLQGQRGAVIDASHLLNGVEVTAPGVRVSGLTVQHAVGEGILLKNTSRDAVVGNSVHSNNTGVRLKDPVPNTYPFCQPLAQGANDCGENIHLLGSSHNVIEGNSVTDGAGGILLSDETGPTSYNRISGNTVADNHTACGVVMAGHNPAAAPDGKRAPAVAGVFGNTVTANSISRNGLQGGGGAGVQMATGVPGGAVYKNTVTKNSINGNGHSGVTLHSHAQGQYLDGNVVTGNQIGTNNRNGDVDFPAQDKQTTGVFVGTVAPVSITVRDNAIGPDHFGIFTSGPVTVAGEHHNAFLGVAVAVSTN